MTIPTKPLCPYNPERVCRNQCDVCWKDDEDAPEAVSAADADADRGDAERARERDEQMYLSVLADAEGSV